MTRLSLFTEFTFEGKVAGGELSLAGNTVETAASKLPRAVGESAPCTLEWLTSGGCTPCTVGGGTCGPDAQKLVPPGRTPAR